MSQKSAPEKVVREIKRQTRRKFSAEEKIRIVLEGLRGEVDHLKRQNLHLKQLVADLSLKNAVLKKV
jgi:transposase-like protein